ncbi:LOW QUALITY PROTEIN: hypothetical protein ACHAWT_008262 [Skeletonema menzelii]
MFVVRDYFIEILRIVLATDNNLNVVVTPELAETCRREIDAILKTNNSYTLQMNLATCIHAAKHYSVALEIYSFIETSFPSHAYVHVNKAAAHLQLGEIGKARDSMRKYFDAVGGIDGSGIPTDTIAAQRGSPCSNVSSFKFDSVSTYLHRAIEIGDEEMLSKVYANYGGHLSTIGEDDGAAEAFIKAFLINLKDRGDLEAATAALVRRALIIPKVAKSAEEAEQTRINFRARIRDVIKLATHGGTPSEMGSNLFNVISKANDISIPKLANTLHDWTTGIQVPHFHYHYLGFHDNSLQKEVAKMFTLLCPNELHEISPHLTPNNQRQVRPKKRVGIISSLIGGDEPHGLLVQNVVRDLHSIFDFFVISVLNHPVKSFTKLQTDMYSVLVTTRWRLLSMLVMGAPVTSGIETFDYFLSGDLLEHPYRTQLEVDHYTEQVVLFDGQAISFPDTQHHLPQDEALAAGDAHSNVTALEQITLLQKQDTHLIVCFQNIAKIQPRFDHVLVDILQADPKAHIILQASRHAAQTSTLTNRLEKTLRERLCGYHASQHCSTQSFQSRIHFIARIPSDQIIEFLQRCGTSSVVLQPFPFDGSKTTSDAINAGVPLVTFPQPHLRGRMTSTLIRSMFAYDVPDDVANCCIANSVSEYVSKALRLTSDLQFRRQVSAAIQRHSHRIFDNKSVSLEWGKLLTRALEQRISDQELEYEIGLGDEDKHYRTFSSKAIENDQRSWRESIMLGHRSSI